MKIQNISDVNTFFKVIDSCKGTVELVSRRATAST